MNILVGIGNEMKGDDAVGIHIARKFREDGWITIDCATVPENYAGKVIGYEPEKIVIVDAADMGLKPGEIRRIPKDKMGRASFSTHSLPLSIFISHLERQTNAEIVVVGIQPKSMYGEMSKEIKNAAERVIDYLKKGELEKIEELK